MSQTFRWALIGPGGIAQRFAQALPAVPGAELAAVLGRDPARAQAFAERYATPGAAQPRVLSDAAELLADARIDGVYIATPHAQHGEWAQRCLQAGKPVLCEKPLVPNLAQAKALVALAREQNVFLMEAVWTRFLPIYAVLQRWLAEQAIGEIRGMQSSFCFPNVYDPAHRLYNPALAGGALLDIGIYNLTVTRWVLQQALGACPEARAIHATGLLAPTGVDQRVAATLDFGQGLSSQFICAVDTRADNGFRIFGSRGSIELPQHFWQATQAVLHRDGQPSENVQAPHRINGFEGEIEEAQRCIRAGQIESAVMPHAETLATLAWMDEIRAQLGVRYPFE
jgi:predicted dehydrogenase